MKAALVLIAIYVGAFLVAIQGASQSPVEAASQASTAQATAAKPAIDPAKEADIRSLMELIGVRDQIQESVNFTGEQYREKLLATVPNSDKGQTFVNNVITSYEKKFDVDEVTEQIARIYDQHYTDEEIRGLLQFYGSPLGQKVAGESPRVSREIQSATRNVASRTAHDALQAAKQANPEVGQNAHLTTPDPRRQFANRGQGTTTAQTSQQSN